MYSKNEDLFKKFRKVHDEFERDPDKFRKEFNEVGLQVTDLMRVYIDDLCRTSESSGYGNYTSKLAEKFLTEVRIDYPLIDEVGIE